jgi:fibronectin type 3 domain-containing protein
MNALHAILAPLFHLMSPFAPRAASRTWVTACQRLGYDAHRKTLLVCALFLAGTALAQAATTITLSTSWKFKTDPTNVGESQQWFGDTFNDGAWQTLLSGKSWESQGITYHGSAWYRQKVTVPSAETGVPLTIRLAAIDSDDDFYWNGELVAGFWGEYKYNNRKLRTYTIPASKIRYGASNTMAIRIWGGALGFQGISGSGVVPNSGLVAGTYTIVLDRYQLMARPSGGAIATEQPVIASWDFSASQKGTPFEMVFRVDPAVIGGASANLAYTIKDFYGAVIKTGTVAVATGADGISRGVAGIDAAASQKIYMGGRFKANWKVTDAVTGATLFDNASTPLAVDHLSFATRDQTALPALTLTNESTPYGTLKKIDEINCAESLTTEVHPFMQGGYNVNHATVSDYQTPAPAVAHTVPTILGKPAREAAFGWFAYRIGRGTLTPGKQYLLRIEYPEDKPRYCPVEIQVGQNYLDVGWKNGLSSTDVYDNWPLSNTWKSYDVIVPLGDETTAEGGTGDGDATKGFWVYFYNKMKPGDANHPDGYYFSNYSGGPAVATMKLYEIDPATNSPAITLPSGLPQRVMTFDWERQPTAVPSDLVNYARLMGYSAISPLALKWAFSNWGDPAKGFDAVNVDAAHYWVNSKYAIASGTPPAAPVPGFASVHQRYLAATKNSGVDYIPRIEYGGSFDLPASARAIGSNGAIAPPNRFASWGANLLNTATYSEFKAYLDSQLLPNAAANPQLKGALWRIRSDRMQISYGLADVNLFCSETGTIKPSGMSNAQLAAWASSGTVGGKYDTWWHGKRAAFHKQLADLLKTYRSDMSLYYYNWDVDKFSMRLPDIHSSYFYSRVNALGGDAAYANDRAARAAFTGTDYINVMTSGNFSDAFISGNGTAGPIRADQALRPSFYSNIPGLQLFAPANWLCYADKPEYLNYFRTMDGMAMSNAVSYDEIGARSINPKFEGNMVTPAGGPNNQFSMALELLAWYHADARTLTYTVYTYGRGFADAHRRFAQAFRALPAIPGSVVPATPTDTKARVYTNGTSNYVGIAYKGYSAAALTVDIPGSWTGAVVKNLVSGATIPTSIVGGKLRIAFSSGPMELNSFLVTGGTPALAPVAPTGVTTTASSGKVTLTWQAVSGATSYIVKRSSTLAGGPYTTVATSTTASYTDNAASNGTTYYYEIVAANASGQSVGSALAIATPGLVGGTGGQITANFNDGDTTTAVDGYAGMAGGGWFGPWAATKSGTGSFSNSVTSSNPLAGGGNRLAVNLISGTVNAGYPGTVGRKFDATVVDGTQPYKIRYRIRWDSTYNPADSLILFGDVGTGYAWGTGSNNTWVITTYDNGGNPVWRVNNGNGAGGSTAINTTMPVAVGTVYTMTVNVDPVARSWTVLIDNGTTQYQSGTLGFRNAATGGAGNTFYLGGSVRGPSRTLSYSVDGVIVTNGEIAEPPAASATANFTAGDTTSAVDGYVGMAGDGWFGPWAATKSGAGSFSNIVTSSSPLDAGGNRLSANLVSGPENIGYPGTVGRKFDAGIINPQQPYTVSYKIRWDSAYNTADSLILFGDVGTGYAWGTGSNNTWVINTYYNAGNPVWRVNDGNGAGGSTAINTPVALTVGTVYTMTVKVDPIVRAWTVLIDNGSTQYQSGPLGFRNAATGGAGNSFYLGGSVRGPSRTLTYSVDTVSVTQP